jgi:hypothetical protein
MVICGSILFLLFTRKDINKSISHGRKDMQLKSISLLELLAGSTKKEETLKLISPPIWA